MPRARAPPIVAGGREERQDLGALAPVLATVASMLPLLPCDVLAMCSRICSRRQRQVLLPRSSCCSARICKHSRQFRNESNSGSWFETSTKHMQRFGRGGEKWWREKGRMTSGLHKVVQLILSSIDINDG
jgi:hypothetical protein